MHYPKKNQVFLAGAAFLLLAADLWAWQRMGPLAQVVMVTVSATFVFFGWVEAYRRLRAQITTGQCDLILRMSNHYRQLEALISLYTVIKPDLPLPPARGWAASPDLLKRLTEILLQKQPKLVVEAGSGLSTLITAYCLKRNGKGKVISLEHNAPYAEATRRVIAFHGLQDIATVVHAPLTEVDIDHNKWLWYDLGKVSIDLPIDLLTIDGPPDTTQPLARYPALPLLFGHLDHNATILLDDGIREDERETVARWEKEFPEMTCEYLGLEKGAFILQRHSVTCVDTTQQDHSFETALRS